MKQIYNHIKQWRFKDEKEIHDITVYRHFVFLKAEEATTKKYNIDSFHTLICNVENGFFWNAEKILSLFGKTVIRLPQIENFFTMPSVTIKEKNFKPIELIERYELVTDLSIKDTAEKLSTDDFIEYLKERGVLK